MIFGCGKNGRHEARVIISGRIKNIRGGIMNEADVILYEKIDKTLWLNWDSITDTSLSKWGTKIKTCHT